MDATIGTLMRMRDPGDDSTSTHGIASTSQFGRRTPVHEGGPGVRGGQIGAIRRPEHPSNCQ